jgi:hypothetical protein
VEKISELRSAEAEEYIANTRQGWRKPGVLKKKPAQWVFLVFLVFFFGVLVFFWFFYLFAQKREFLGFFQFQEFFLVHPDVKL